MNEKSDEPRGMELLTSGRIERDEQLAEQLQQLSDWKVGGVVEPDSWVLRREKTRARLRLFRQEVQRVLRSHQVLSNAMVDNIMTEAETFVAEVRAQAESQKQHAIESAIGRLNDTLRDALVEIRRHQSEGIIPAQMLEWQLEQAMQQWQETVTRIRESKLVFAREAFTEIKIRPV
ncbi:MAG: hypothetical protein HYV63_28635 [Candidatus Schekmanbacteria bacterium]|nr:hypothetical protein [Candidatus Schekmanbacteria bacterium]